MVDAGADRYLKGFFRGAIKAHFLELNPVTDMQLHASMAQIDAPCARKVLM